MIVINIFQRSEIRILKHPRFVRFLGPRYWAICSTHNRRHVESHHVRRTTLRRQNLEAVSGHLHGSRIWRTSTRGGTLCKTHIPLQVAPDDDKMDQNQTSLKKIDVIS
jgi:hypothetical protein